MGRKVRKRIRKFSLSDPEDRIARVNAIFRRRGVAAKEIDLVWQTMAWVVVYQIEHREGPVYKVVAKRLNLS